MDSISRRSFLAASTVIVGSGLGWSWTRDSASAQTPPRGTWLLFTKSAGFEHDVVKRPGDRPSFLFEQLAPVFAERGLELVEAKDGRLFEPDAIRRFAGFVFYTTGDLTAEGTDKQPPMSAAGKGALLDAVAGGVPFIGLHSATDTFRAEVDDGRPDPFTQMIGARFMAHGEQQKATVTIADAGFPGARLDGEDRFELLEEWYAFDTMTGDLKPIHLLQSAGMKGGMYAAGRAYPITWTRQHGRGKVFYTAMGHREDVIASPRYRALIGGAVDWCAR